MPKLYFMYPNYIFNYMISFGFSCSNFLLFMTICFFKKTNFIHVSINLFSILPTVHGVLGEEGRQAGRERGRKRGSSFARRCYSPAVPIGIPVASW